MIASNNVNTCLLEETEFAIGVDHFEIIIIVILDVIIIQSTYLLVEFGAPGIGINMDIKYLLIVHRRFPGLIVPRKREGWLVGRNYPQPVLEDGQSH